MRTAWASLIAARSPAGPYCRRAAWLAAALLFVAVLPATPAFGLRGQLVHPCGGGKAATAPVVKSFAELDGGAPPGMAPNVIAGEARPVMEVPLSTGKTWVMWVAPTRSGGFCTPHGCDRDRRLPFSPEVAIPGPTSPTGEILAAPVIFEGATLIQGASTVEIAFVGSSKRLLPAARRLVREAELASRGVCSRRYAACVSEGPWGND